MTTLDIAGLELELWLIMGKFAPTYGRGV